MPCGTHAAYDEAMKDKGGINLMKKNLVRNQKMKWVEMMMKKEIKIIRNQKRNHIQNVMMMANCQCDTEIKQIVFESEVKSDGQGVFSGYGSIFGNEDQGNDIVQKVHLQSL